MTSAFWRMREGGSPLPPASAYWRGHLFTVAGGPNQEDVTYICERGAGGGYSWIPLAAGGP